MDPEGQEPAGFALARFSFTGLEPGSGARLSEAEAGPSLLAHESRVWRPVAAAGKISRMSPRVAVDPQRISELCRRRHIRRLALFGSVLREDFGPASDIDVLVEFEPGHVPGFAFFDIEEELAVLFGRRVDLHTLGSLSRYFRDRVAREALNQYVGA